MWSFMPPFYTRQKRFESGKVSKDIKMESSNKKSCLTPTMSWFSRLMIYIFDYETLQTITSLLFIIPKKFSEVLYFFSQRIFPFWSKCTIDYCYPIRSRRRRTKVSLKAVEIESILLMGGFRTSLLSFFRSMIIVNIIINSLLISL